MYHIPTSREHPRIILSRELKETCTNMHTAQFLTRKRILFWIYFVVFQVLHRDHNPTEGHNNSGIILPQCKICHLQCKYPVFYPDQYWWWVTKFILASTRFNTLWFTVSSARLMEPPNWDSQTVVWGPFSVSAGWNETVWEGRHCRTPQSQRDIYKSK